MIIFRKISNHKTRSGIGITILLTLALLIAGCGSDAGKKVPSAESSGSDAKEAASDIVESTAAAEESTDSSDAVSKGEDLVIPISELSTTASFYSVEIEGTPMEIIAVIDNDGNIRTAFNTCQICYSSGRGYYVQSGDKLVCQNCGNQFTINQVEIESGGCNPWPIFAENKTVTEDSVIISYDFLNESRQIFARWKISF